MAGTTWSVDDKSTNVTVSGGSLTATGGGSHAWVRTVDKTKTGKAYWEFQATVWASANTGHGLAPAYLASPDGTSADGFFAVFRSGNIWLNGNFTSSTLGARANGDIIGVAIDRDAMLGWFRVAPSGDWNGSATANPATGAEGINLAAILSGGLLSCPVATFGASSEAVTANFGDSAFTGAVPSGYTAGFLVGPPPVSSSTVLLCHFDGVHGSTSFTDASPIGRALVAANATVSTAIHKFGTGSGNFTASSSARAC
jgi:hypothetical protein